MPVKIVIVSAINEQLDPATGQMVKKGCGACVAFERNELAGLRQLVSQSTLVEGVEILNQPTMALADRNKRWPAVLLKANPRWYPCIVIVDSADWKRTAADLSAPLQFSIYNGQLKNGQWAASAAPLKAADIFAFAERTQFARNVRVQPAISYNMTGRKHPAPIYTGPM